MSVSERIPGMRPGSTLRNIAVGMIYLIILSAIFGGGDDTEADADEDIDSDTGDEAAAAAEEEQTESDGEDAANSPDMDADDSDAEAADVDDADLETDGGTATSESDNELSEEEVLTMFEMVVTDYGIDLRTAEMDGDRFVVEYYSTLRLKLNSLKKWVISLVPMPVLSTKAMAASVWM